MFFFRSYNIAPSEMFDAYTPFENPYILILCNFLTNILLNRFQQQHVPNLNILISDQKQQYKKPIQYPFLKLRIFFFSYKNVLIYIYITKM